MFFYTGGNTPEEEKLMDRRSSHEDSGMMSERIRGREDPELAWRE